MLVVNHNFSETTWLEDPKDFFKALVSVGRIGQFMVPDTRVTPHNVYNDSVF